MDGYNIGLFTNQNNQPIIQQFVVSGFQSTIIALKQWSGKLMLIVKICKTNHF